MTELALPQTTALAPIDEIAANYAKSARSDATRRAYASQIRGFLAWTAKRGLGGLPAEPRTVARYLASRAAAGVAVATLAQALSALSQANVSAGFPSPRLDPGLREVWAGICRTEGTRPRRQARAFGVEELRRACKMAKKREGLAALRDRALLLLGFAGGFRRGELVALDVADLRDDENGMIVTIRRSKTDQQGRGRELGIPFGSDPVTCPVRAVRAWLAAAGIEAGPVFRPVKGARVGAKRLTCRSVPSILAKAAKLARVPVGGLSGHSLRAGFITAATRAGASVRAIQDQTGHTSAATVARYVRSAGLFEENATSALGL